MQDQDERLRSHFCVSANNTPSEMFIFIGCCLLTVFCESIYGEQHGMDVSEFDLPWAFVSAHSDRYSLPAAATFSHAVQAPEADGVVHATADETRICNPRSDFYDESTEGRGGLVLIHSRVSSRSSIKESPPDAVVSTSISMLNFRLLYAK